MSVNATLMPKSKTKDYKVDRETFNRQSDLKWLFQKSGLYVDCPTNYFNFNFTFFPVRALCKAASNISITIRLFSSEERS